MNSMERNAAKIWRTLAHGRFLMALAAILAALLLAQGVRYFLAGRSERAVLRTLTRNTGLPPARDKVKSAQEYDDAVMGHGMLGQNVKVPTKLWGIIGDSALFGTSPDDAQPVKAGESVSATGEKVIEVRINEVVLEKDGKQRTEAVFDELKPPPPPPAPSTPPAPPESNPGSGAAVKAEAKPASPAEAGGQTKIAR